MRATKKEVMKYLKDEANMVVDINEGLESKLKKLGFKAISNKLDSAHKMKIAYEKYLFVSQESIDDFNEKLRQDTIKQRGNTFQYKRLDFIPLEDYTEAPPMHVLEALEKAKKDEIFDDFKITKIKDIVEVPDPILFGKVNGCSDYFFIAQWDDDIRFEDILSMNTGRIKDGTDRSAE